MCKEKDYLHSEKVGNLTVKIDYDQDAPNPMSEFDNAGEFYRYDSWGRLEETNVKGLTRYPRELLIAEIKASRYPLVLVFDVCSYGGRVTAQRVNWWEIEDYENSEGFYIFDAATIREEWGTKRVRIDGKRLTPTQQAERYGKAVLHTQGDYYSGNVYGFVVEDENGEDVDSCFGFYGDYEEGALSEGIATAKAHIEYEKKQAAKCAAVMHF